MWSHPLARNEHLLSHPPLHIYTPFTSNLHPLHFFLLSSFLYFQLLIRIAHQQPHIMSLRNTLTRSLKSNAARSTLPSTRVAARAFTKPSSAVFSAEDEEKARKAYEKHREQVEPKFASVDESITWQEPKVSCPSTLLLRGGLWGVWRLT